MPWKFTYGTNLKFRLKYLWELLLNSIIAGTRYYFKSTDVKECTNFKKKGIFFRHLEILIQF